MATVNDLLSRSNQSFAPEDPFSNLQAGRTLEETAFAQNKIAARGDALRRGAAGRIRQQFARQGGPRGAQIKAQTQSALGASAQTQDALTQDQVASEAARRREAFDLASARGQFGFGVEAANASRFGQDIDLGRLGENARQFDISQQFRMDQAAIDAQAALQRNEGLLDLQNRQFDFSREQFASGLRRGDQETIRQNALEDAQALRDEEDRQRLIAAQEGIGRNAPGVRSQAGLSGRTQQPILSRQFGGF